MATGDIKGFKTNSGGTFDEVILQASAAETNTGTEISKFVTPAGIAGSLYRKVYIQTATPSAPMAGDLWIDTN